MRGKQILMQEGGIDEWLHYSPLRGGKSLMDIPDLANAICAISSAKIGALMDNRLSEAIGERLLYHQSRTI